MYSEPQSSIIVVLEQSKNYIFIIALHVASIFMLVEPYPKSWHDVINVLTRIFLDFLYLNTYSTMYFKRILTALMTQDPYT